MVFWVVALHMKRTVFSVSLVAAMHLMVSCSGVLRFSDLLDEVGALDGGEPLAVVPDAGADDGGEEDAGLSSDEDAGALVPDAGPADAGMNGGGSDAGQADAGTDAGAPDAGIPDGSFDCKLLTCPGGLFCSSSSGCVPCRSTADCAAGVCDPASHRCVPCLLSSDCSSSTLSCDTGAHVCVATCASDTQCSAASDGCNLTLGRCQQCDEDESCGAGPRPYCQAQTFRCVACRASADCSPKTPWCEPTSGTCQECLVAQDCPEARPWCNATGTCVASI